MLSWPSPLQTPLLCSDLPGGPCRREREFLSQEEVHTRFHPPPPPPRDTTDRKRSRSHRGPSTGHWSCYVVQSAKTPNGLRQSVPIDSKLVAALSPVAGSVQGLSRAWPLYHDPAVPRGCPSAHFTVVLNRRLLFSLQRSRPLRSCFADAANSAPISCPSECNRAAAARSCLTSTWECRWPSGALVVRSRLVS